MLTGPIDATRRLLDRTGLTIDDIDVIEINEAFASVVLAWEREVKPDMARVNPQRRRDRVRPSGRRDRCPTDHHRAARARTHRRGTRADHDVLRRRPRNGHDPRARRSRPGHVERAAGDRARRASARARRPAFGRDRRERPVDVRARLRAGARHAWRSTPRRSASRPPVRRCGIGVTDARLVVWSTTFWMSRPGSIVGRIALTRSPRSRPRGTASLPASRSHFTTGTSSRSKRCGPPAASVRRTLREP